MKITTGTIVKTFDGEDYEVMHTLDGDQVNEIKEFIRDITDRGIVMLIGIDGDGDNICLPLDYFECVEALLSYVETDPPEELKLILNGDECKIIK